MESITDAVGTVRYDKTNDVFYLLKPGGEGREGYWVAYLPDNKETVDDSDINKYVDRAIGYLNLS